MGELPERGRRRRLLAKMFLLWTAYVTLIACGAKSPALESASEATTSKPKRIISLSPNITEILEGVGAFDRVVAVSDFCDYPPAALKLPRVGGWQTTSLEQVHSLRPDLVIMS